MTPATPLRDVRPRDSGTSLIELLVGMALMGVFMTIFTGAIVTMYRSANKAESVNVSSAQLNQAFTKLDTSVRYASAISAPGPGGSGDSFVELSTTNTGAPVCTQLRMNRAVGQLQQRTWNVADPGSTAPQWQPLASAVSAGAGQPAFTLTPASAALTSQRLTIRLESTAGNGTSGTTSQSVITFTAVNSGLTTATSGFCTQWGRP